MTEEVNNPINQEPPVANDWNPEAEEFVDELPESVDVQRQLEEKTRAYEELEAQMRRLAADFDNFRRRQAQEKENLIKFAGERILERFLDVLDNFERAIDAGKKATDPEDVVKGVEMIYKQVQNFLDKEGVAIMDAKGQPFDPNQHEAVVQQPADDVPDQTVLEVFRKGYVLNGRVLRHAMVTVASNPNMPPVPPASSQGAGEAEQTDQARSSQ